MRLRPDGPDGLGTDVVRVLCRYGFFADEVILGLLATEWEDS